MAKFPTEAWPKNPRPEGSGIFGQRGQPNPAGSSPLPPGPAAPAESGLPGLGRPTWAKWTRPYGQIVFQQADQVPAMGTRLWLGAGTPVTRGIWTTDLFDSRPDLRAIDGYEPQGTPVMLTNPSGIALELFVKIRTATGAVAGMFATPAGPAQVRVLALEYGDPADPTQVTAYTAPIDITAQVLAGNGITGDSVQRFINLGPLRYWQVQIAIDVVVADFATLYGPVRVAGGYY